MCWEFHISILSIIYWWGRFWKAGIISCHNWSMGRWEFEKSTALPMETVFSKCVERHFRRQTFCGGCYVGGVTHFCVIVPAVYSRIKKIYVHNGISLEPRIIPVSKVCAWHVVSKCWYYENSAVLCYYAASSVNFLSTFRDNLSGPVSRVKNGFPKRR